MTPTKPSQNEQDYFGKVEFEKKRALSKKANSKIKEEERKRLKELHHMRCSKCGMELGSVVFKGFLIDKCYECGAIVLDQKELEKLVGEEEHILSSIFSLFK